ncbi:MAG: hypothetical protein Kow0069_14290 [Promethearchaeota archaeon]
MASFNNQIRKFFKANFRGTGEERTRLAALLDAALGRVEFGAPVESYEQLHDVLFFARLLERAERVEGLREAHERGERAFSVALSLTRRCGNACRHCSTDARLNPRSGHVGPPDVPAGDLREALREACPSLKTLHVSCEGDPLYYEGGGSESSWTAADAVREAARAGAPQLSFQHFPPPSAKLPLLERVVDSWLAASGGRTFFPQVSFNLYSPRAGLRRVAARNDETSWTVLALPGIFFPDEALGGLPAARERLEQAAAALKSLAGHLAELETEEEFERSFAATWEVFASSGGVGGEKNVRRAWRAFWRFLRDTVATVEVYASRGIDVHFEVRGDGVGPHTNLAAVRGVLDSVLSALADRRPDLGLSRCEACSRVHYHHTAGSTVPLGRASALFPGGRRLAASFYEDHVNVNSHLYLCPNWGSEGSMTFDTAGFPQLCYSNVALMAGIRNERGPSLYRDGFPMVVELYLRYWERRAAFFLTHARELAGNLPNGKYCPLDLFKEAVGSFGRARTPSR